MKKFNKTSIVTVLVVSFVLAGLGLAGPTTAHAATSPTLGAAASFSVLADLSMSAAGPGTTVSGDLGLSTNLAGSRTGPWTVGGTEYFGPLSLAATAHTDALGAFNNLALQTSDGGWGASPWSPLPGVYTVPVDITFTGTITLSGGYDDVWVFQVGRDMTFSGSVVMAGNAQPCHVFWQIGRDATIASGSAFKGTLIASRDVTLVSGATVNGRIISLNSSLTTDGNAISGPTCAAPATLYVIKLVVNGSGGTAVPSNFTVHVKSAGVDVSGSPAAGTAAPGTPYSLSAGTYVVSEEANASYVQSFTGACDSSGNVTLASIDKTCTIVNTDIPAPAPVVSSGGGGSSSVPSRTIPLIGILKVPSPLALPSGSGSVVYNYTAWNVGGQQALTDVTVTDDKCSPVTLLSGDLNGNGKLDPGEYWKYSCTTTLSKTTTNTSIATGHSDDTYRQATIATAIATVVVGVPTQPPLINIVKVPSRLTPFPVGGGDVTYTYTVTNPGVVAMHDVIVTDDKCAPVSGRSGDTNGDNLLDPGETWTYTCRTNVPVSTRNIATAEGKANGFTALGYAFATVLVTAPGGQVLGATTPSLPNTGFPPEGNGAPWAIIVLSGILMVVSTSLVVALRRRRI
jgi:hypothetical protein